MGLFRAPRLPQAKHICVSANPSAPLWVYSASLEVSFFAPTAVTFSVDEPISSSGIMYDYIFNISSFYLFKIWGF